MGVVLFCFFNSSWIRSSLPNACSFPEWKSLRRLSRPFSISWTSDTSVRKECWTTGAWAWFWLDLPAEPKWCLDLSRTPLEENQQSYISKQNRLVGFNSQVHWRLLPPALAFLAGLSAARVVTEALVPSTGGSARLLDGTGSRRRPRGRRRLRYLPLYLPLLHDFMLLAKSTVSNRRQPLNVYKHSFWSVWAMMRWASRVLA